MSDEGVTNGQSFLYAISYHNTILAQMTLAKYNGKARSGYGHYNPGRIRIYQLINSILRKRLSSMTMTIYCTKACSFWKSV